MYHSNRVYLILHSISNSSRLNSYGLYQDEFILVQTKITQSWTYFAMLQRDGGSPGEHKEGLEVKSRDIGSTISTPSKRKSKRKSEATSVQTSSSLETHAQSAKGSPLMSVKFMLGVALVSVIIGVILGKRY